MRLFFLALAFSVACNSKDGDTGSDVDEMQRPAMMRAATLRTVMTATTMMMVAMMMAETPSPRAWRRVAFSAP